MKTAGGGKKSNANCQFNFLPLLVIIFGFLVLTGTSGCFDSGSDSTAPSGQQQKTSDSLPSNHIDDVSGTLHAPGKYTPYTNRCTACHGQALEGGAGPSCNTC
ncbi:MAG: hypothetical protein R3240_14305, partial [Gammaproteobacteria bacterium]|nr:hypothetical protein [Gammaproteobacteria bacterium]